MWYGTVDMPRVDFVALTAAYNWEPYLALMLVIATEGDLAAGDTSVGLGPMSRTAEIISHVLVYPRGLVVVIKPGRLPALSVAHERMMRFAETCKKAPVESSSRVRF
jgi:hypothetical protein